MTKPLFRKGPCFPTLHPRCRDRDPVNPARGIRDITAYVFKTLAAEKLASARYMFLAFEAVSGRVITTVLSEWRPGNTKLGVFTKSLH